MVNGSREVRRKAQRVVRVCDCGGEMNFTVYEMTRPFGYRHKCSNCGTEERFEKRYPFIEDVPA